MRILTALHRFAESGEGNVKKLQGESGELRLRVGDYRIRFTEEHPDTLRIHSVLHRRDAHR
jgi:mRNA-degrading endonuclease RelE of RelBE toxin-antitoxin system